ncbi:hypothetical protein [Sphingobacterium sp. LRF_L2]|uniref:hypothetical protein n=1 Tax=Sphingobacterium sp. LRF_L2 TaxID=3369421 RepID=UPI003F636F9B
MTRILYLIVFLLINCYSYGQMIMNAEGIKPDNICNPNTVYFLTGLNAKEVKAKPIQSIELIQKKLNETISFAKENPSFEGKASIQFAVNCKGEVGGGFHVVTKSGNESLDTELVDFFKTITEWNAGKISKKKTVDSWYMWRLEIKDGGVVILNR